jgi:hypothetical protein
MSLRSTDVFSMRRTVLAAFALLAALPTGAQYPGQVTKSAKDTPELRAIAVLEWTGEAGKPKASRLVPVAVLDSTRIEGDQLQDGGIYLARPEPLALAGEVEYELERNGQPIGLYEIKNAGQEQGSWVGYGAWKPLPVARPKPSAEELAQTRIDEEESDQPVLHRKKHPGDAPAEGAGSGSAPGTGDGTGSASGGQAPASDPDRPTLHRKTSSDSAGDSGANAGSGGADSNPAASANSTPASAPASDSAQDSDRPILHKRDSSESASGDSTASPASAGDPDRPVLRRPKKKPPEDVGRVDSLPDLTDPDRPRLKRGKSSGDSISVVPSLMGLPPDLEQAVAVSDAKPRPPHPWSYSWSNPDDEERMKSALEDIARAALGLNPPPPAPAPKRTKTQTGAQKSTRKSAKPAPAPPKPAPLLDEQFRVFELAYGSGATLVLSARTDAPRSQQKFVTLLAQPDLYGNVLVLLKSVTDGAHLDETPRMRLVDAVDAMADNRGELLFELRGETQRQFALYRVLRGQAEKLFVTGGGEFGTENSE